ncbi:MAG: hypothetical protein L6R40_004641 [Gallowayella cf. fulva]|nr:MAG: hypothetical protein L6R40_004641 [Xanthomendoza cf. fulva]
MGLIKMEAFTQALKDLNRPITVKHLRIDFLPFCFAGDPDLAAFAAALKEKVRVERVLEMTGLDVHWGDVQIGKENLSESTFAIPSKVKQRKCTRFGDSKVVNPLPYDATPVLEDFQHGQFLRSNMFGPRFSWLFGCEIWGQQSHDGGGIPTGRLQSPENHLEHIDVRLHQAEADDAVLQVEAYTVRKALMGDNFYEPIYNIGNKPLLEKHPQPKARPGVNALRVTSPS